MTTFNIRALADGGLPCVQKGAGLRKGKVVQPTVADDPQSAERAVSLDRRPISGLYSEEGAHENADQETKAGHAQAQAGHFQEATLERLALGNRNVVIE